MKALDGCSSRHLQGQIYLKLIAALESLLRAPVPEMTYAVSSGTLNSTIPYHTLYIELFKKRTRMALSFETWLLMYLYLHVIRLNSFSPLLWHWLDVWKGILPVKNP